MTIRSAYNWFTQFSLALIFLVSCSQFLLAEDCFWTGDAYNGDWNDLANWLNADELAATIVPQAGDLATFDRPTGGSWPTAGFPDGVDVTITSKADATDPTQVELPTGITINELILAPGGQDVQLTFSGAETVTLTANMTVIGGMGKATTIQLNDNTLECANGTLSFAIPDDASDSMITFQGGSSAVVKVSKLEMTTGSGTSSSEIQFMGPAVEVTENMDVTTDVGNVTLEPQDLIVGSDLTINANGDGTPVITMGANNLDIGGALKITKAGTSVAVEDWPQLSSAGEIFVAGNVELKKVRFDADKVTFDGLANQAVDFNGTDVTAETLKVANESGSYTATTSGSQESNILTSMAYADGLAICPEDVSVKGPGESVTVIMLSWPEEMI